MPGAAVHRTPAARFQSVRRRTGGDRRKDDRRGYTATVLGGLETSSTGRQRHLRLGESRHRPESGCLDGAPGDSARETSPAEPRAVSLPEWSRFTRALATILGRSAIPYGYTITVWTSGAAAERRHGTPSLPETFLFIAGAVAAFAVVAFVARIDRDPPLAPHAGDLIRTGLSQAVALGLALGAAAIAARVHGLTAWPLVSFVATVVYLASAGIELTLTHRRGERE